MSLMIKQSYRKTLLEGVFQLRQKDTFCDVTVRVEECEFRAHRVILAASSAFFQGLFASHMNENESGEVYLKEISASIMSDVLQFIYTGGIAVTSQNVRELMMAGNFLLIDALKEICSEFLDRSLDIYNCFSLKEFAKKYNCKSLEDSANEFICAHFVEASKTKEFLSIDQEAIAEVISHDNLVIEKEEEVYEALVRWIKHDYEARKGDFEKHFQSIRLKFMCKNYLAKHVQQEALVLESLSCTQTLLKAMSAFALSDFSLLNQTERESLFTDAIVCCGGYPAEKKRSKDNQTFCYIPSENKWSKLNDMNYYRVSHAVAVFNNTLFAFGSNGRKCEAYNARLGSWTEIADSPCNIQNAVAVTLCGQIYVLGGIGTKPSVNTVLCYKPASDSWSEVASMGTERRNLCAVAHDGNVYAFGGVDRSGKALKSAEKYNPDLDCWINIASMKRTRVLASATVLDGKPFVIGGFNINSIVNGEVYDADVDQWTLITTSYGGSCYAAGVAAMQNNIYLIGGHNDGFDDSLDSVVCRYWDKKRRHLQQTKMDGKIPFGKQTFICCGVLRIANKFLELGDSE